MLRVLKRYFTLHPLLPPLSHSVRDVASSDIEAVKELKQFNSEYGQEKFEVC
jgi:hypothetical protein